MARPPMPAPGSFVSPAAAPCLLCNSPGAGASGMCPACAGLVAPPPPSARCAACGRISAAPGPGGTVLCLICVQGKMSALQQSLGGGSPFGGAAAAAWEMAALQQPPLARGDLVLADIIGWRIWRVTPAGYLRSLTAENVWLPGEAMEGEVEDSGPNGVHVFRERAGALSELTMYLKSTAADSYALGSVLLWGEVVEHERGYRAERAKVVSIDDVVWKGQPPWHAETRAALAFLRERYGVAGDGT